MGRPALPRIVAGAATGRRSSLPWRRSPVSGRRGLRWRITICAGRALSVAKHQRKLIADLRVIGPKRGSKREDGCDRPPGDQAHEQGVFDQDTARFATPKTRYQPENRRRNRDRRAGKRAANSPGERSKARRKTPQGDRHPPRRRYKTVPRILHDFLQAFLHLGSPRSFALFPASPGSLRLLRAPFRRPCLERQ